MDPSTILDTNAYFLQQGILGVIIVVLIGVIGALGGIIGWSVRRYDAMVKEKDLEIKGLYESVNKVQDLRIGDNQKTIAEAIKTSSENTAAIASLKQGLEQSVIRLVELIKG